MIIHIQGLEVCTLEFWATVDGSPSLISLGLFSFWELRIYNLLKIVYCNVSYWYSFTPLLASNFEWNFRFYKWASYCVAAMKVCLQVYNVMHQPNILELQTQSIYNSYKNSWNDRLLALMTVPFKWKKSVLACLLSAPYSYVLYSHVVTVLNAHVWVLPARHMWNSFLFRVDIISWKHHHHDDAILHLGLDLPSPNT